MQLEQQVGILCRDEHGRFNSIKVQLERSRAVRRTINKMGFNSIKVQLELSYNPLTRGRATFQFHKGAIRTRNS